MQNVNYKIDNEVLTISNGLFNASFNRVYSADVEVLDSNGLSMPYTRITAHGAWGDKEYFVWEDLPLVYTPSYK